MHLSKIWGFTLGSVIVVGAGVGACGSDDIISQFPVDSGIGNGIDTGTTEDRDGDPNFFPDGSVIPVDGPLVITPATSQLTIDIGQTVPTVALTATVGGKAVAPAWSVERGELGSISQNGLFTPGGKLGGTLKIFAGLGNKQASATISILLRASQNGSTAVIGPIGAGGYGGVGGTGPGAAVTAAADLTALTTGTPVADAGLGWLYPYDKTVWPRGILAPLLQWTPGTQAYDAISIHLQETNFDYVGTFQRKDAVFKNHPIPEDIWKMLLSSNEGEDVNVTLTFAKAGVAYGPIKQTWKVAKAPLKGIVYYHTYGTNLAKNYDGAMGSDPRFGGATLAIKPGADAPTLVAGKNTPSGDHTGCRVCHSVAAQGGRLITEHGDSYTTSSGYDLANANVETALAPGDGRYAWPALYPDGSMLFSNSSPAAGGTTSVVSSLYSLPTGAAVATTGLPADLKAALPIFSPDGKMVAFNYYGGAASDAGVAADQRSIATMTYDPAAKKFGPVNVVFTPPVAGTVGLWSTFLPTSDALVVHVQTRSNGRDFGGTRSDCDASGVCSNTGVRAELWWVDLKTKQAHKLDQLNGAGYLPVGANLHDDDATLNYKPSANPISSGGYAWVVFQSRRLYGNIATVNPFWSDPRFHDISNGSANGPTTKKLWVAAIDLNAPPGTDPSHPAFYLPGQELFAGNARGFWVVDPCKNDGNSCETGDECCGGYCRAAGDGGALICTATRPTCAQEFEKCENDVDCCGKAHCIGGRCGSPIN